MGNVAIARHARKTFCHVGHLYHFSWTDRGQNLDLFLFQSSQALFLPSSITMRNAIGHFVFFSLYGMVLHAQEWVETGPLPQAYRYEDIHFISVDTGWSVSSGSKVVKTINGGQDWEVVLQVGDYLRSVEFLNADIGFVGSLDGGLFRTDDGGITWIPVQENINGIFRGVCGLSHAGQNVYGVGLYSGPAYFIASSDTGLTWTYTGLDSLATGLVECQFRTPDIGFISGWNEETGAIILKTNDGGKSWRNVFESHGGYEYVWKIFFVSDRLAYGAVESFAGETTIVKTLDGGESWTEYLVDTMHLDIQGIGFINAVHGWVGPRHFPLYETVDGGFSWNRTMYMSNINRFFSLNDGTIYASGSGVYRYQDETSSIFPGPPEEPFHLLLDVTPNPFWETCTINIYTEKNTAGHLLILDQQGMIVERLFEGQFLMGAHEYSITTDMSSGWPRGLYSILLHTHEGMLAKKVLKIEK